MERDSGMIEAADHLRPGMFSGNRIAGVPDLIEGDFGFKIINMPVPGKRWLAVMVYPGFQPSRSKGAADINVSAR